MQKNAALGFLVMAMLVAIFSSCASNHRSSVRQSISQSMQQMESGNFQEAIDSYNSASESYPQDKNLAASYTAAIEEIKRVGDSAMERGNFKRAEETYLLLLKNFRSFKRFEKSLSFTEESLKSKLKDFRSGQSKRQFQQSLRSGDYQKAIDVYRIALKAYPDDRTLTVEYAKSIEEIRKIGDAALAKEDYSLAGKVYYVLEKNLSSFGGIEKKLSFTGEGLKERIAGCRMVLTKRGLEQYRRGDLTGAIATWKTILVFDPDNTDIKKSIDTASAQLKKLKQKK